MPIQVQLPDGSIGEFPDGMADSQIEAVLQKQFPSPKLAAPGIKPEARTVGNYLKEGAYGVGRGVRDVAKGGLQMATHPQEAASQFATQSMAAPMMAKQTFDTAPGTVPQRFAAAALRGLEEAPVLGPMVQYAEKGGDRMGSPEAFGAAMEATTSLEAPGAAGKGVGALLSKAPDVARVAAGTGKGIVGDLIKGTEAANEAGDAYSGVHAAIETAREKALKEGNEKYTTVNEKLNKEPANRDAIQAAVAEATSKIKGSDTVPPILKDISSRVEKGDYVYSGGQKFGPGTPLYESVKSHGGLPGGESTPLGYKDLQGYYSELGTAISKGNLPGDIYTALDTLHEAIGSEMQRIADSRGLGAQLTDARNYWRRMKQTFGKPMTQPDAASQTLHSLAPDLAERDTIGNRVRLLGSFDPEIPKQFERLNAARKAAKGGPTVTPGETKKIGSGDVRGAKAESLENRTKLIEHRGGWVAAWPLFHVLSSIMRGEIPSAGGIAMESAGTYGAVRGVANILRSPKVVEFLTRATPKDIEQIPPDLRGNFPGIIQAAQKGGIKVAPALARAFQVGDVVGQTKKRVAAALQP